MQSQIGKKAQKRFPQNKNPNMRRKWEEQNRRWIHEVRRREIEYGPNPFNENSMWFSFEKNNSYFSLLFLLEWKIKYEKCLGSGPVWNDQLKNVSEREGEDDLAVPRRQNYIILEYFSIISNMYYYVYQIPTQKKKKKKN